MTHDRSSLHAIGMDPLDRLQQLPEVAPPPDLDARVRRRFAEVQAQSAAPLGQIESAINALVLGSYTIYALGELTRILFG